MAYDVQLRTIEPQKTAAIRETTAMSGIANALGGIFGEVMQYIQANSLTPTGGAFGRYHMDGANVDIEAGFTVVDAGPGGGRVAPGELPGGEVAVTLHVGTYDRVAEAYDAIERWMRENGREAGGDMWELYLSPPEEVPPRTEVYVPLKPRD